ncbi:MAG: hypothetical protein WBA46_09530 [Thermomicrobiales bacterium]
MQTTDRRFQTCERMTIPAPRPATPERRDIRIYGTGELVGHVEVRAWSTEAWVYDEAGAPLMVWMGRSTGSDANLTAADRVWRHYEGTGLLAPKHLRYGGRRAA